jgi:hypothetical protein
MSIQTSRRNFEAVEVDLKWQWEEKVTEAAGRRCLYMPPTVLAPADCPGA